MRSRRRPSGSRPRADVCRVLEIGNPSMAASRLDEDEKATLSNVEGIAVAQVQALTIVSESGLYSLVLTSRKPQAMGSRNATPLGVSPPLMIALGASAPHPRPRG